MEIPAKMSWFKSFKQDGRTRVASEIVSAANDCAKEMLASLTPRIEKEKNQVWYEVLCEFLFCFLHIASRLAVSLFGQTERTTLLLTPLGPLVAEMHVETYLGHWPADLKKRIETEFLQNLSGAQKEYSSRRDLYTEGKPFSGDAVISLLAFKVAEITGDPNNVIDLMLPGHIAATALAKMNLRRLVEEAGKGV
jgi:hypothetical protein